MPVVPSTHRGFVDPLNAVRQFDQALTRLFHNGSSNGSSAQPAYGVDVREDADHLYVEADLPGFAKDEVDVTLDNQTLTITAEQKPENHPQPEGEWLLKERRPARFQRSFKLAPNIDGQKIEAKLADGVLRLTLNKREETKPRKIQVS